LQPIGEEQAENQSVENVLAEIQRHQCLARILSVAIDAEGDSRSLPREQPKEMTPKKTVGTIHKSRS